MIKREKYTTLVLLTIILAGSLASLLFNRVSYNWSTASIALEPSTGTCTSIKGSFQDSFTLTYNFSGYASATLKGTYNNILVKEITLTSPTGYTVVKPTYFPTTFTLTAKDQTGGPDCVRQVILEAPAISPSIQPAPSTSPTASPSTTGTCSLSNPAYDQGTFVFGYSISNYASGAISEIDKNKNEVRRYTLKPPSGTITMEPNSFPVTYNLDAYNAAGGIACSRSVYIEAPPK